MRGKISLHPYARQEREMLNVSWNEIVWLVMAIIAGGLLTGILAGLFGIGGGGIIVPVLYEVFRIIDVPEQVRMQLCVGTSLAIIVPTTVRSYLTHKAKGAVIPNIVRIWALPATLGVAVGSVAAAFAPGSLFKVTFVIFASLMGLKMILGRESWNLGTQLPGRAVLTGYGFITGHFSALVGVSGGSVSNAVLTLYGRSMQQAVATSAGIGVPITIAGTIGYGLAGWRYMPLLPPLSIGFVSLIGFLLMAPVSSFTASYGARLAHRMPKRQLEIAFGIFLMLVALRFIVSLI
jgi:uncharacterized membrane protein YfcA